MNGRDILPAVKSFSAVAFCTFLVVLLVVFPTAKEVHAQQGGAIEGTVTDASTGEPLPGVNVVIEGTQQGAATGAQGEYTISDIDPGTYTLQASFVGYDTATETVEVTSGETSVVDFPLQAAGLGLEEVVVVGYGEQERRDLTGAISSIPTAEIEDAQAASVEEVLQGRISGVQVTQTSAAPGGGISVRIRGTGSLTSGGEPLYVIDGIPIKSDNTTFSAGQPDFGGFANPEPQNALSFLNANDIQSIEVLKDASATAIYGSRGANGVVLITTKRGDPGETIVDFNSTVGIQQPAKTLDLLNGQQFATLVNESRVNQGLDPFFSESEINSFGEGTDWQKELFESAPVQNYHLGIRGGSDDTRFAVSGGYRNQQGLIRNSGFERYSGRVNFGKDITENLSFGNTLLLSRTDNNQALTGTAGNGNGGVLFHSLVFGPTVPLRQENGDFTVRGNVPGAQQVIGNPVATAENFLNNTVTNRILANVFGEYTPLEGLTYKLSLGLDYFDANRESYSPSFLARSINENLEGIAEVEERSVISPLVENTLTYTEDIGEDDQLKLTGLQSWQHLKVESINARVFNFPSDLFGTDNIDAASGSRSPQTEVREWTLSSFMGRANYTLDDKYLFTGTLRADGSSKFGEGNKWGVFPSFAAGWRVSEEQFLRDVESLSNLKLRFSYGITGNQEIGIGQSLARLGSRPLPFGSTVATGFFPSEIANSGLKWETTSQMNIGLDAGFLDQRVSFSANYFQSNTEDLLLRVQLPIESGIESTLRNEGEVENSGVELSLTSRNFVGGNFEWTTRGNITFLQNEVTRLGPGETQRIGPELSDPSFTAQSYNVLRVGEPIGSFFGYETAGIWQEGEDPHEGFEAGNIHYVDQNGDNQITGADRVIIGDPNPDLYFGLTNTLTMGDFDLNAFIQGAYGNDVFNANKLVLLSPSSSYNALDEAINRWTPQSPSNKIPKPGTGVELVSDRQVEDGSYLRLQNLTLGYTPPSSLWGGDRVRKARIYVGAKNLFTLTGYDGYDPEVNAAGQSVTNRGLDLGSYPRARTYTVGVNLSF
jgi:TonB-linked SusC/RagA family outer membrane protein